jgi:hypothetical protein
MGTVFSKMARLGFRLQGPVTPGHGEAYKNPSPHFSLFTFHFFLLLFFLRAHLLPQHSFKMPPKSNVGTSSVPALVVEENVVGENEEGIPGDNPPVLIPLENQHVSLLSVKNEWVLRVNYDIGNSVRLHFQSLSALSITGGDISLFERMFMAGLRLPFPDIAWELLLYLKVAPSQIFPNSWRYLFASFILWRTVIGTRMLVPQFMNVYRPAMDSEGVVKLWTRQGPSFIFLKPIYSKNKDWEKQVFLVSGEWEWPKSMKLAESQRISHEWRALDGNLMNPPEISDAEQEEVTRMIDFCNSHHKVENDFNTIVTDKSLNDHLGYKIPENKVPLTKVGKPKFTKSKVLATSVPSVAQRGTSRTRKLPSQATGVKGIRTAPSTASLSREKRMPGSSQTLGHDTATDLRVVVEPEAPLF